MREILFRGKKTTNGEWVVGNYARNVVDAKFDTIEDCENFPYLIYGIDRDTVGQYTGLNDKNGKRIFEGDIVRELGSVKRTYEVMFDEGRGGWYPFACGDGCGCCEDEVVTAEWCEVIGNIHDRPELIAEVEG